jgi:hypothetical protein
MVLPREAHDPLDSCNENLPEKRIHRNYASCPDGTPRRAFCCTDAHRGRDQAPAHPVMGGSRCKPPVVETAGHCFRPVIYNENTYHSVQRRKRPREVPARKTSPSCPRKAFSWGIGPPGPLRLAICSLDPSLRWSQRSTSKRRRCGRRSDCARSLRAGRNSRWALVRATPTAW